MFAFNVYELLEWSTRNKIKVPEGGKPVVVNIHFLNVGKTNAINAIVHDHILFGSQVAQFRIEPADSPDTIGQLLVPGTTDDEGILVTAISIKELLPQGGWVNFEKLSVIDSGGTRNYTTSQLCPANTRR